MDNELNTEYNKYVAKKEAATLSYIEWLERELKDTRKITVEFTEVWMKELERAEKLRKELEESKAMCGRLTEQLFKEEIVNQLNALNIAMTCGGINEWR
jgi:hypothetical protein